MMRRLRPILIALALFALLALPPARLPMAHAASGQVSIWPVQLTAAPSTSATNYRGLGNAIAAWDTVVANDAGVIGGAGAIVASNWTVKLGAAPGAAASGKSYAFTLLKNEVATAVTVTILETATTATDSTHTASFSPGDRAEIQCTPANTPAATVSCYHVMQWTGNAANQTPWSWSGSTSHTESGGATWFMQPTYAGVFSTEASAVCPCPTGGVVSGLYVDSLQPAGVGENTTVTLRVNGADSLLTCSVSGASAKAANDTTHSITINPGDLVCWKTVNSAGSATLRTRMGANFAPTTNGEQTLMGTETIAASGNTYLSFPANSNATEANAQTATGLACTAKKLYFDSTSNKPANGQAITLTFRNGAADTALVATVTGNVGGTNFTGNDTADNVTVGATDLIDIHLVTGAGNLTAPHWGFVLYVAPAASSSTGQGPLTGVGSRPHAPFFPVGAN